LEMAKEPGESGRVASDSRGYADKMNKRHPISLSLGDRRRDDGGGSLRAFGFAATFATGS